VDKQIKLRTFANPATIYFRGLLSDFEQLSHLKIQSAFETARLQFNSDADAIQKLAFYSSNLLY